MLKPKPTKLQKAEKTLADLKKKPEKNKALIAAFEVLVTNLKKEAK